MLLLGAMSVVMILLQMNVLDYHVDNRDLPSSSVHETLSRSKSMSKARGVQNTTTTNNNNNNQNTETKDKDMCDDMNDEDHGDDDLKPILKILCQAGYNISKDSTEIDRSVLPKWSDIMEGYGPPTIVGLDTCQKFRDTIPANVRHMAPAGMFNSGTNLLHFLIQKNCNFRGLGPGRMSMRQSVPWGKHRLFSTRANHTADHPMYQGLKHHDTLAVVVIRDPYTWLQSMCRQPYSAQYRHSKKTCPNLVPYPSDLANTKYTPVNVKYETGYRVAYDSMAHLWNEWYGDYIEFEEEEDTTATTGASIHTTNMKTPDTPFLVLRMEDLIFHADTVLPQMCECVGGKLRGSRVQQITEIANRNAGIDRSSGKNSGLLRSIVNYGNITRRRDGYPAFQLVAAKEILDSRLMNVMGYRYEEILTN